MGTQDFPQHLQNHENARNAKGMMDWPP